MSTTLATIVAVPPMDGMVAGLALTFTWPTAAVPTAIFTALALLTLAPPEIAVIVAVPFALPALNVTNARPLTSVVAVDGWIVPSDVVKVTSVPECGGVPDASITCAITGVAPLTGRAVAATVSVMVDPEGARSGTL